MKKDRIGKYSALFFLISVFVGMLYFSSATASLRDSYQPGIEELQKLLNPIYISIVILVSVLVVKNNWLLSLAKSYFLVAFICCVIMAVFVSIYHGPISICIFPENRTLASTVERALFQPSFSGRSTASAVFNGAVVLMALGVTRYVGHKRYNKAN